MTESDYEINYSKSELKKAYNLSIEKWNKIEKIFDNVFDLWCSPCGFCDLAKDIQYEYRIRRMNEKQPIELHDVCDFCFSTARFLCREKVLDNDNLWSLKQNIRDIQYHLTKLRGEIND